MTDTHQAIYDAVRSKISGGNVGDVVREIAREAFDISFVRDHLQQEIYRVSSELTAPHVLMRPELVQDGNAFLAMYGDLPTGCVGTGSSPAEAMADFDKAWYRAAVVAKAAS
jgi:hypothetical protein